MNIQTAQSEHPEAFAAIERRLIEWSAGIDDHPTATPVAARLVTEDGVAHLELLAVSDYLDDTGLPLRVAFRHPLNHARVLH